LYGNNKKYTKNALYDNILVSSYHHLEIRRIREWMSLTDSEISGGIGYGNDQFGNDIEPTDMRALLFGPPSPSIHEYGSAPLVRDGYQPLRQEPAGRSFRPDQLMSSVNPRTFYHYPAWDPDDPVSGIKFEPGTRYPTQTFPPENALQTAMQASGSWRDISRDISPQVDPTAAYNSYNAISKESKDGMRNNDFGIGELLMSRGIKEAMISARDTVLGNNTMILFVLLFILFIVVAYLQQQNIQRLQGIVESFIDKR
jgi:hypothetical protein